ncbi:MAG: endolytic transglycosylase MltG [Anaerolineae bacterium]|nr:endolytic transglycosylase MltG [Anaerolineae bacterium]MBL8107019.1 endolytic transglycosylase MltG [Anaerolineales bacterium]MCC7191046.1 endolytic transglycosylase MltG [Anaerolineales bacterium]
MRKLILPILLILTILCFLVAFIAIPSEAARIYGPPAPWLTIFQRAQYSARLLWYDGLLTRPLNGEASERNFRIESGQSVSSIAASLQDAALIRDAESFRDYLVYSGLDTSIQAGEYKLSAAMSAIDIAREIQDASATEATFTVLAGWRMEEIAASLPTSGLAITPDEFLAAARNRRNDYDFLDGADSLEGFLFPDSYILSRNISVNELMDELLRNFSLKLTSELTHGFEQQGLTVYQAVIVASIVEREAVQDEEKPLIASVYLNRLNIGMKLEADPTVQYALGFDFAAGTWWKNPLSLDDLQFDSPFNTYVYAGLPPAPISNPDLDSLQAVAFPAETPYFFFRAKCDGSGYHSFAETFEEHVANGCE